MVVTEEGRVSHEEANSDNIKERTGQLLPSLLHIADDKWAAVTTDAFVGVRQRRPGVTGLSSGRRNSFFCDRV